MNLKICFFKKIRQFINEEAALSIYKSTILPIIEYADFVYDYNIKYINNKLQQIQNQGLYTVFNQHFLPLLQRDSTETLHRQAKLYRLYHRRRLHLLSFAFGLSKNENLLDDRDIHTRRHDGKLFVIPKINHYKYIQNPTFRSYTCWNELDIDSRNIPDKDSFIISVKSQIEYPYKKIQ